MSSVLRGFVRSHGVLNGLARGLFRRNSRLIRLDGLFGEVLLWSERLPSDFDCVVGVPRAGLMVGGVLADRFGLPLSTPDNLINGTSWMCGTTKKFFDQGKKYNQVLLVDEAIGDCLRLNEHKERLEKVGYNVKTASLYVNSDLAAKTVDYYYKKMVGGNGIYEWDLLDNSKVSGGRLCVDLDGVLCKENKPYLVPRFPLRAVVTARLVDRGDETKRWLDENNVVYEHLFMRYGEEIDDAQFKVDMLRQVGASAFWESDYLVAKRIRKKVKIPVLCTSTMQYV